VLGLYYMTRARELARGEGKVFASPEEVRAAYDHGAVDLQAKIKCRIDGVRYDTTVGRVLLTEIVPKTIPFSAYNKVLAKKELGQLIDLCYRLNGEKETVLLADRLRTFGYNHATAAGISISLEDMIIPEAKARLLEAAQAEVKEIEEQYLEGLITDGERYNKVIDIWARVTEEVAAEMMTKISSEVVQKNGE